MARAQEQPERDSDSDEQLSGSGSDSESYDPNSSSSSNGEEEDASEEEDVAEAEAAAKKQRVQADINEMRRMMADMDAIKARLKQRLALERQARLQRVACEDREREEKDRKAAEEARIRHVEVAVQTDTNVSEQQINVSQQGCCPPHLADGAAGAGAPLSAVDGDTGFADAAPKKAKPAGLSLYDLVKVSGVGLSLRVPPSTVRQADPPALPTNEHEQESPEQEDYNTQSAPGGGEQVWSGANSLLSQGPDSVEGDSENSSSHHAAVSNRSRGHPSQSQTERVISHHYDENSASVSNSLVSSSDTDNRPANVTQDHKFNAAALLSTGKRTESAHNDSDKTDEQREMEAIQFLLFGQGGRR